MSQAIHYIKQDHISQNGTALHASIPTEAVTIRVGDSLDKTALLSSLATTRDFPVIFHITGTVHGTCLTDSDARHLILDLTVIKKINTEDFNVFKTIIEEAYQTFGKPQLWIIVPLE